MAARGFLPGAVRLPKGGAKLSLRLLLMLTWSSWIRLWEEMASVPSWRLLGYISSVFLFMYLLVVGSAPEASYWAYTRSFCLQTAEEGLPKRAKKAKAEQAKNADEDC